MSTDLTRFFDPTLPVAADQFLAVGTGADVDEAFDAALVRAEELYGTRPLHPSIVSADPGAIRPAAAAQPLDVAVSTANALGPNADPGEVIAVPFHPGRLFSRRRVTSRLDDPTIDVPALGVAPIVTAELERFARALPDVGVVDGEMLETFTVSAHRERWKPVVEKSSLTGTARTWVARLADGTVVASAPTAGAARREAVVLLKAGPVAGIAATELQIVQVTTRPEGEPHFTVRRVRVSQRATVRTVWASLKPAAKVSAPEGWVFAGRLGGEPTAADEFTAADETP